MKQEPVKSFDLVTSLSRTLPSEKVQRFGQFCGFFFFKQGASTASSDKVACCSHRGQLQVGGSADQGAFIQ